MRIAAVSDLHGHLPESTPECDVLLIGGDSFPFAHHPVRQKEWCESVFIPWLIGQPALHKIGICGNHDDLGYAEPLFVRDSIPWTYLEDEGVTIDGVRFHGSPWTPIFMKWVFQKSEEELLRRYDRIPSDTNVLITHGPPRGILDLTTRGERVGSTALRDTLPRLDDLRLHIFGHIHERPGRVQRERCLHANVTFVDRAFRPHHRPILVVDL